MVPGGKPGPRRTKPLVIADAVGPSLQRKGDLLANQDTCLSALRGEMLPQFDHILYNSLVTFIGLLVLCKAGVITQIFFLSFTALRQIILTSGTLLKDDIHKVIVKLLLLN